MTIVALPGNAVRAIGSAQILTDPASLVKELVENSLDAGATSVLIEISTNTLDKIQVKDNGHGIPPADRALVCKRYCTSKIRDLVDLKDVGSRSLGFRGEALASAVEMSSKVTLTTRVGGEATAVNLEYDREGLIAGEKRASHAVGTTVQVDHFLKNLPVRRQTAEKGSAKMLIKVKKMLQTYVLARPHVRLSLKVLKARTEMGNLTYASKPSEGCVLDSGAITIDAATKILGKRLTDQCQWTVSTWSSACDKDEPVGENKDIGVDRDDVYSFESLVVSKDCADVLSINNTGQYISVDARPMSCNRGTFKKIVQNYKYFLRSAIPEGEKIKFVDPFLFMNIVCPRGSYDANVEPAKDDVLFLNADLVLRLAEKAFKAVYGQPRALVEENGRLESPMRRQGFDLLLARKHAYPHPQEQNAAPQDVQHAEPAEDRNDREEILIRNPSRNGLIDTLNHSYERPRTFRENLAAAAETSLGEYAGVTDDATLLDEQSTWKSSMYTNGDEDQAKEIGQASLNPEQCAVPGLEDGDSLRDVNLSNPWAYAKMNAKPRPAAQINTPADLRGDGFLPTPQKQVGDVEFIVNPSLSTEGPHYSDPSRSPSNTQSKGLIVSSGSSPEAFPYPLRARRKRQAGDSQNPSPDSHRHRPAQGALDTWVRNSSTCLAKTQKLHIRSDDIEDTLHPTENHQHRDFASARTLQNGIALSDIQDITQRPRKDPRRKEPQPRGVVNSFVSPINDPERVWFDTEGNCRPRHSQQAPTKRAQPDTTTAILNLSDDESDTRALQRLMTVHPDIATIMEYEARKQKATQRHRERLRIEKAEVERQRSISSRACSDFGGTPNTSPHDYRYSKAIAALHGPVYNSAADLVTGHTAVFTHGQPIVQQHEGGQQEDPSTTVREPRKSSGIHLQKRCAENYAHELTLVFSTSEDSIHNSLQRAKACDDYVSEGVITEGLSSLTLGKREEWKKRLNRLVRVRKGDGSEGDGVDEEISIGDFKVLEDYAQEAVPGSS